MRRTTKSESPYCSSFGRWCARAASSIARSWSANSCWTSAGARRRLVEADPDESAGLLQHLADVGDRDVADSEAVGVGDAVDDSLHARPSPASSARRPSTRYASGPVSAAAPPAIVFVQPAVAIAPTQKSSGNTTTAIAAAKPARHAPRPRHLRRGDAKPDERGELDQQAQRVEPDVQDDQLLEGEHGEGGVARRRDEDRRPRRAEARVDGAEPRRASRGRAPARTAAASW